MNLKRLLVTCFLLAALCTAATAAFPVTITDAAGFTVTVLEEPRTIVSLAPTNTEILFAIGAGDRIIGDTLYCNYPEQAEQIEKVGGYSTISIEKITALNPDIIFANDNNGLENIEHLKNLGFTVIVINPESMSSIYSSISMIGDCVGETENADALITDMQTRIQRITDKLANIETYPKVMHAMSVNPYWISGANTFQDELITLAGGRNAFSDVDGWGTVTLEKLIVANPDLILTDPGADMGTPGENTLKDSFYEDNRLTSVNAVKNENIFVMDADIFDRGGPRAVDALERLAELIHPEIFGEFTETKSTPSSPGFSIGCILAGLSAVLLLRKRT